MLLRAYARYVQASGRAIRKFSVDAHSSTGGTLVSGLGQVPLPGEDIVLAATSSAGSAMGRQNLIDWLDGITWPYAPLPDADT
jgi:hypothetical protein